MAMAKGKASRGLASGRRHRSLTVLILGVGFEALGDSVVEEFFRRLVERGVPVDRFVDVVAEVRDLAGRSMAEVVELLEERYAGMVPSDVAREVASRFGVSEADAVRFVARRLAMWAVEAAARMGLVVLKSRS